MDSPSTHFIGATATTDQEKESLHWRDQLLRALPHVDLMKELYQGWVRASNDDQLNTKLTLVNFIRNSITCFEDPLRTRMHRLAFYLVETFEHWTYVQDMLGACGTDSSVLNFNSSFENDVYNMVILLQETLTSCVKDRLNKASTASMESKLLESEPVHLDCVESKCPEIRKRKSALVFQHSGEMCQDGSSGAESPGSAMGEACETNATESLHKIGWDRDGDEETSVFRPLISVAAGGDAREGLGEENMAEVSMETSSLSGNADDISDQQTVDELVEGIQSLLLAAAQDLESSSESESDFEVVQDDSSDSGIQEDDNWEDDSSGYGSPACSTTDPEDNQTLSDEDDYTSCSNSEMSLDSEVYANPCKASNLTLNHKPPSTYHDPSDNNNSGSSRRNKRKNIEGDEDHPNHKRDRGSGTNSGLAMLRSHSHQRDTATMNLSMNSPEDEKTEETE